MGDVTNRVLMPLTKLYGPMPGDADVVEMYVKALQGYADDVLDAAVTAVASNFLPSKITRWPTIAHLSKACRESDPGHADPAASNFVRDLNKRREASRLWADGWMAATSHGQTATAEGWGRDLRDGVANIHYELVKGGARDVTHAAVVFTGKQFEAKRAQFCDLRRRA